MGFVAGVVVLQSNESEDDGVYELKVPEGFHVSGGVFYLESPGGGFKRLQFRVEPNEKITKMEG